MMKKSMKVPKSSFTPAMIALKKMVKPVGAKPSLNGMKGAMKLLKITPKKLYR